MSLIDVPTFNTPAVLSPTEKRTEACLEILNVLLGETEPQLSTEIRPFLTTDKKDVWQCAINSLVYQKFVVKTGAKSYTRYMLAANYDGSFAEYVPVPEKKKTRQKVTLDPKKVDAVIDEEWKALEDKVADLEAALSEANQIEAPLLTLNLYADHVRLSHEDAIMLLSGLT